MLLELSLKNFTIIDSLKVEFTNGLNIITGETGAGKSIIIDAIGLLLGDRATTEYIKTGKEKAEIQGIFDIGNNKYLKDLLEQYGLDDDDNVLILCREVSSVGKNICRVNNKPVTLGVMKEIGQYLVDIHGQHEHQSLLNWERHIDLLDLFGGSEILSLRYEFSNIYKKYKELYGKLVELKEKEKDREQRLDFLIFQVSEIERANIKINEEDELRQEKQILSNSEKLFKGSATAYQILYQGDSENPAVYDKLSKTIEELEDICKIDNRLQNSLDALKEVFYKIEDISINLRDYRDSIEFNPERLDEIEERINLINQLKRKYGGSIEDILNYYQQAKTEINELSNIKENSEKLALELRSIEQDLATLSIKLSNKRKKAAKILEENIAKELAELKMEKSKFKVEFNVKIDNKNGININNESLTVSNKGVDIVEFLITTNPGEPLKPLSKIVSGGEMSRIMLALKTILARIDNIPTLIFDEIDTGIGGSAAQAVAEKLSYISREHQVICVTHLPQIASMADNHFYIEKRIFDDVTKTQIKKLGEKQRIKELARMLGGSNFTDITLNHAKEMIETAKEIKQKKFI